MEWVEAGLAYLKQQLEEQLQMMLAQESGPTAEQWRQFHSRTDLYFELRVLGPTSPVTRTIPVIVGSAPPSRKRISLPLDMAPALGSRIAALRLKAELSQADLGKRIGQSGASIYKIESGDRRPSVAALNKIAAQLGVTPEDLLANLEEPETPEATLLPDVVVESPAEKQPLPPLEILGTYDQQLRGGLLLRDDGGQIYLYESVVERMRSDYGDLQHGDRICAVPSGRYNDGTPRYFFKRIAATGTGENPNIGYLVGAVIRHDNIYHCVENAENKRVLFNATDARGSIVAEGDVATVCYWKQELVEGSVVRGSLVQVHQDDWVPQQSDKPAPMKPGKILPPISRPIKDLPVFNDCPRITIVGGRHWDRYREVLSLMNTDPQHISADGRPNLEEGIRNEDIVIVITTYMNHPLRHGVSAAAKKNQVLYYETEFEQISGFTRFLCDEVLPAWNSRDLAKQA